MACPANWLSVIRSVPAAKAVLYRKLASVLRGVWLSKMQTTRLGEMLASTPCAMLRLAVTLKLALLP